MNYIIIGQTYQMATYYWREHREKFLDRRGKVIGLSDYDRSLQGLRSNTEVIVLDNCWFGPWDLVQGFEDELDRLKRFGVTVRSGGEWLG